ncbi:MAG TPA: hypothetical protein VMT80_01820 [Candidatus Paceibacterota bacterium]|nr:hypothetical protein [Candidatus Paceibacterota bacterium]
MNTTVLVGDPVDSRIVSRQFALRLKRRRVYGTAHLIGSDWGGLPNQDFDWAGISRFTELAEAEQARLKRALREACRRVGITALAVPTPKFTDKIVQPEDLKIGTDLGDGRLLLTGKVGDGLFRRWWDPVSYGLAPGGCGILSVTDGVTGTVDAHVGLRSFIDHERPNFKGIVPAIRDCFPKKPDTILVSRLTFAIRADRFVYPLGDERYPHNSDIHKAIRRRHRSFKIQENGGIDLLVLARLECRKYGIEPPSGDATTWLPNERRYPTTRSPELERRKLRYFVSVHWDSSS